MVGNPQPTCCSSFTTYWNVCENCFLIATLYIHFHVQRLRTCCAVHVKFAQKTLFERIRAYCLPHVTEYVWFPAIRHKMCALIATPHRICAHFLPRATEYVHIACYTLQKMGALLTTRHRICVISCHTTQKMCAFFATRHRICGHCLRSDPHYISNQLYTLYLWGTWHHLSEDS
jgi:hypothetical protein